MVLSLDHTTSFYVNDGHTWCISARPLPYDLCNNSSSIPAPSSTPFYWEALPIPAVPVLPSCLTWRLSFLLLSPTSQPCASALFPFTFSRILWLSFAKAIADDKLTGAFNYLAPRAFINQASTYRSANWTCMVLFSLTSSGYARTANSSILQAFRLSSSTAL